MYFMDPVHELCPLQLLEVTKKRDTWAGWLASIQHLAHINLKLQLWKKCVIYIYIFTSSTIDILNHAPAAGFLLYLEVPEDSLRARLSVVPDCRSAPESICRDRWWIPARAAPVSAPTPPSVFSGHFSVYFSLLARPPSLSLSIVSLSHKKYPRSWQRLVKNQNM